MPVLGQRSCSRNPCDVVTGTGIDLDDVTLLDEERARAHSETEELKKALEDERNSLLDDVDRERKLHKALLRYHDPQNWPLIRAALKDMGLSRLIGSGEGKLVPLTQPQDEMTYDSARRKNRRDAHEKRVRKGKALTQHTGLPPRKS